MSEIKCPHCGKMFTVDESGYASLLEQVRNSEFEKELKQREVLYNQQKQSEIALVKADSEKNAQLDLAKKEAEINELKMKVAALEANLRNEAIQKQLEINNAVRAVEIERDDLKGELKTKDKERRN